jgi:hypothetical protein
VFSPAVVSTAFDNLQVNGIVLSRRVLLNLEGLVLLTAAAPECPATLERNLSGVFFWWEQVARESTGPLRSSSKVQKRRGPVSPVRSGMRSKQLC